MIKPNRVARAPGWALLALLATTPAGRAGADEPSTAGLRLGEVVEVTLSSSPELAVASAQVQAADGRLLAARGAFDLVLETSLAGERNQSRDAKDETSEVRTLEHVLRARRLFRMGLLLTVESTLVRSVSSAVMGASNSGDVRLTASLPLLRDRGGAISSAAEEAAERDRQAAGRDRRHAAAERVLAAVTAYWDYQAADRRLAVLRSSEERARRTVEEMRVLVKADERTPADVVQMQGYLGTKRVARIAAERTDGEARAALGLAMGLPAGAIAVLARPATDFPPLADRSAPPDPARLIDDAYRRRADLAAAVEDELAARLRTSAAESDRLPRLDLSFRTGYEAVEAGPGLDRLDDFFSPLGSEPALDARVQLTFEFPVPGSGARGRALESASLLQQSRLFTADLRRRIATGVLVALDALARSEEAVRESEEAVRLFESSVRFVQRRFQVGSATIFDLIQAQDALTDAELSQVQSQRDYAVAVAGLRFQIGRLVEGEGDALRVPLTSLLRPP